MSDPSLPLIPDDGAQDGMALPRREAAVAQPYALTGVLAALVVLLAAQALLPGYLFWALRVGLAVAAGLTTTLLLGQARARLPLVPLAILAAMLGMLYALPYPEVFVRPLRSLDAAVSLLRYLLISGIFGILLAAWLAVRRYPHYVLGIIMLFNFVLFTVYRLFMP